MTRVVAIVSFMVLALSCTRSHTTTGRPASYSDLDFTDPVGLLRTVPSLQGACDRFRARFGWLLTATARQDRRLAAVLMESVGLSCPGELPDECWTSLLERLSVEASGCGPDAVELLTWHAKDRLAWGTDYFSKIPSLLRSRFSMEAAVALVGGIGKVLRALEREREGYRLPKFIRLLGFPCARNAPSWTWYGPEDPGRIVPGPCFPSCPKARLREGIYDPISRRISLLSSCDASDLGIGEGSMSYLDTEMYMVLRASGMVRSILAMPTGNHPLVRANRDWIEGIRSKWNELRLLVPPPVTVMSQEGSITPPLCIGAWEPVTVRRYVVLHPSGSVTTGLLPHLVPSRGVLEMDQPFPGSPMGQDIRPGSEVVLYADKDARLSEVYSLLYSLYGDGVARVQLVFRNLGGVMRTVRVELTDAVPHGSVRLSFTPHGLSITAPDKDQPEYSSESPYHFTNLRNAAERIRRRLPASVPIAVEADPSFRYLYLARLLGNVTRSTSGRMLYERIQLVLPGGLTSGPRR